MVTSSPSNSLFPTLQVGITRQEVERYWKRRDESSKNFTDKFVGILAQKGDVFSKILWWWGCVLFCGAAGWNWVNRLTETPEHPPKVRIELNRSGHQFKLPCSHLEGNSFELRGDVLSATFWNTWPKTNLTHHILSVFWSNCCSSLWNHLIVSGFGTILGRHGIKIHSRDTEIPWICMWLVAFVFPTAQHLRGIIQPCDCSSVLFHLPHSASHRRLFDLWLLRESARVCDCLNDWSGLVRRGQQVHLFDRSVAMWCPCRALPTLTDHP